MQTSSPYFFLAYASSSVREFTPQELVDILTVSRANNTRVDVTGMLLYRGGSILQALEGSEARVHETMQRISLDGRHRSIMHLYEGRHEERLFAEWSMAFEDLSAADASDHPGLSRYLASGSAKDIGIEHSDHDVFEFFRSFREHMR